MHRSNAPVSLADLAAAGVRLRPYEAVTIVRELVLQVIRGEVAGVPSSHVIRLSASGTISIEGPVAAGGRPVVRAAQLLDSLLPTSDAGNPYPIPGALKLVIARALGTMDLPPFASLEAFADALGRFAANDAQAMVRNLVATWAEAVTARGTASPSAESGPSAHVEPFVAQRASESRGAGPEGRLCISDVRRARRATGMSLRDVSERSRIPLPLLRQLEWGYLFNWPGGKYGRTQLVRYARAAGLDAQLVVATVEPLIEQAERLRAARPSPSRVPVPTSAPDPSDIIIRPAPALPWPTAAEPPTRLRTKVLAALAIPALLAIGLLPSWWKYSDSLVPPTGTVVQQTDRTPSANMGDETAPVAPGGFRSGASGVAETQAAQARGRSDGGPAGMATGAGMVPAYRLATANNLPFPQPLENIGAATFYPDSMHGAASFADRGRDGARLRVTKIVDDSARSYHVRPSPDGTRIAFDSDRDGEWAVFVADSDGRNVRRVSPPGFAAIPSWSPDGTRLTFVRAEENAPDVWNLWVLDLATGDLTRVSRHTEGKTWGGSWFPTGRSIAYSHERQLIIHDLQTGDERVFDAPGKGALLQMPVVSPDGERVVFKVANDGAWLLELADGSMRQILDDPTAEVFTWSPDGRRLAYHSRRSGGWNLWVRAAK